MRELIIDLGDPKQKQVLTAHVRSLKGLHRVTIVRYRNTRTNAQNAYFHAVIVPRFADWCREEGNDCADEEAKGYLKSRFLKSEWPCDRTGEVLEMVRDTSDLDTKEFTDFIEQCRAWILDFCGIDVPPPDPFYKLHEATEEGV